MKRFSFPFLLFWFSLALFSVSLTACGSITLKPPALGEEPQGQGAQGKNNASNSSSDSWVLTSGGASDAEAKFLKTDQTGNMYVAGSFQNYMVLGSLTVKSRFGHSLFVAKLSEAGRVIWIRTASAQAVDGRPSANRSLLQVFSINHQGQIALGGLAWQGFLVLDNNKRFEVKEGSSVFVASLSSKGEWLWLQQQTSESQVRLADVSVASSGVVSAIGNFSGNFACGSKSLRGTVSRSLNRSYLCQFDASGNAVSLRGFHSEQSFLHVHQVVSLSNGQSVVLGSYSGSLQLGRTTLPAPDSRNSYGAWVKVDQKGQLLQVQPIVGTLPYAVEAISDANDSVFIVGTFSHSVQLGKLTLSSESLSTRLFVTRLDSDGSFAWAKTVTPGYISSKEVSLALASDGQLLLSSRYSTTFQLSSFTLKHIQSTNGEYKSYSFLARFSSDGTVMWAGQVGDNASPGGSGWSQGQMMTVLNCTKSCKLGFESLSKSDIPTFHIVSVESASSHRLLASSQGLPNSSIASVHVDSQGRSYMLSTSGGQWSNQSKSFEAPLNTASLSQIDTQGHIRWNLSLQDMYGPMVTTDKEGNSYITGSIFDKTFQFGTYTFEPGLTRDFLVAKISPEGAILWAKSIKLDEESHGRRQADAVHSIVIDKSGHLSLAFSLGTVQVRIDKTTLQPPSERWLLLTRFGQDGALLWTKSIKVSSNSYIAAVNLVPEQGGGLHLLGSFYGTLELEGLGTYKANTFQDPFVLKLSNDGDMEWMYHKPGDRCEFHRGIAQKEGGLVLTGACRGSSSFGGKPLPKDSNVRRTFVAGLDSEGQRSWSQVTAASVVEHVRLAKDASERVHVLGSFYGSLQWGGKSFQSKGGSDVLLLRLTGKGEVEQTWQWGGEYEDTAVSLSFWKQKAIVGGTFRSTFRLGSSELVSKGGAHSFLTQIDF